MIKGDREHRVICAACGQPAVRREFYVQHLGQGGHMVAYDTHAESLADDKHQTAIKRMDAFYSLVHLLQKELNSLPREDRILGQGEFVGFDFGPVRPDACSVRVDTVPLADFKTRGQTVEIALPARPIERIEIGSLMAEFLAAVSEEAGGAV